MPAADDSPNGEIYHPSDQFRHDLKTPLTAIYARAHLLARGIQRSSTLGEEERRRMLAGIAAIEASVREMVDKIDSINREGGPDSTP